MSGTLAWKAMKFALVSPKKILQNGIHLNISVTPFRLGRMPKNRSLDVNDLYTFAAMLILF